MSYEAEDDDEVQGQGPILRDYLSRIETSDVNESALGEIIYTANETGMLELGVSYEDAIMIWKMVELSRGSLKKASFNEMVAAIRM